MDRPDCFVRGTVDEYPRENLHTVTSERTLRNVDDNKPLSVKGAWTNHLNQPFGCYATGSQSVLQFVVKDLNWVLSRLIITKVSFGIREQKTNKTSH